MKPRPLPDIDTAPYWHAAAAGELSLPRCGVCATILFPPKPYCPGCLHEVLEWVTLSGRGKLHSFCIVHMRLIPGFEPPYIVGVFELQDQVGLRITANLIDCPVEVARIGMPVEVVFEDCGEGVALPQFRPVAIDPVGSG